MTWRAVEGYADYLVNDSGQILSLKRGKERLLTPAVSHYGYHVVNLWGDDRKKRQLKVHQLVCRAFNGPPVGEKTDVNHKDGNKLNNAPNNLEWCTRKENNEHAIQNGLRAGSYDILVTNELDGETFHYGLVSDVLRDFDLKPHVLEGLIKGFPNKAIARLQGLYTFQAFYHIGYGEVDKSAVMVKNCLTSSIFAAGSIRVAAHQTGLSRFIINKKTDTGLMVNGFMFKSIDNLDPFPDVSYDEVKASRQAYAKFCKDNNL